MKVSKYFNRQEFQCKCGCGFAACDVELMYVLDDVREHFNAATTITSGCRCEAYNKQIGGATTSMHTKGIAADIIVKDVAPKDVLAYLENKYPDKYGLASSNTFTHIDVRPNKARWKYK